MLADHTRMSFRPLLTATAVRPLPLLLATALVGLVATTPACSSSSPDDATKSDPSSAGAGGTTGGKSSSTAGNGLGGAGKTSTLGGASSDGGAGDESSGAEPEGGGGASAGNSSSGGSSSGGAGSGGSGTLPGNDVWSCIAAGTSCICQNNADPKDASTCTGTYECCFAVPLGNSTRCQCQDPYTSKCEDLAGVFGDAGKVVAHCPP